MAKKRMKYNKDVLFGIVALTGAVFIILFAYTSSFGKFTEAHDGYGASVDNPPVVSVSHSMSSGQVKISASASDVGGYVTQISLYLDNINVKNCVGQDVSVCEYSTKASAGRHTYHSTVVDNTGKIGNSDVQTFEI